MTRVLKAAQLAVLLAAPAAAEAPRVAAVEPPSWWTGHSLNPVRLVIRGEGLSGAKVTAQGGGLSAGAAKASADGRYLFVDLSLEPGAAAGPRALVVETAAGSAEARFDVLEPLPRKGRFQGFSNDDVLYLLMPDRFANGDPANDRPKGAEGVLDRSKGRYYHGGDLQGVIDRLPYLKDLGVTGIWMTPVYANTGELYPIPTWSPEHFTDYHGYGVVDYYAVDPHLGDMAKLRELVDRAHAAGIKIILDQVMNHTGPRHPWAKHAPTPTWYNGTPERHINNTFQKWLLADPYATREAMRPVMEGWYADILPDLNQNDPEVARYLIQNVLWWVGVSGADGLRQDAMFYVPRPFWRDLNAAVHREHPALRVVGEVLEYDPSMVAYFQGGRNGFDGIDTGIDTLFDFPAMDAARRVFLEDKPAWELAASLARDRVYPDPGALVTLLNTHDEPRLMGRPGATVEALELAFSFVMTTRGTPLVYYGDEIGMPGGGDPDNRRDFPGGWRGDSRDAFSASGRTPEEARLHGRVRRLARLRAELEPLRRGRLAHLAADDDAYAFARVTASEAVVVAINRSASPKTLWFEPPAGLPTLTGLVDRLGSAAPPKLDGGRLRIELPARTAAVFAAGGRR